ncbi:MaoC family dehydratase N-terminal domain-containing protein [Piscinibacter sp. HJYY11]|uniref:FAS1-like dehydratase domain-containing protein n=1 Tax=Piscinibacter sp. HJYY11 TaxID=2801333 RepID=UPI00191E8AC2|nr:MaoC family dehydratase N-terminal domain-containing protein [Piscinibacter sp. HJYY11]MBL0730667.1 MaoC family dehydratase N-terminal domain-containing protein [Piscinibacter sp. HJYY11]
MNALAAAVGRHETVRDRLSAAPLAALAATLDREPPQQTVPPLWHWVAFTPKAPASEIGADGHPKRGGFLPALDLPRRMWAGGRIEWHASLHVDEAVERRSTIVHAEEKTGRSGRLAFVTLRHEVHGAGGLALVEEQDIVYREPPRADAVPPTAPTAPADETCARSVVPDPVLLFRYSALTFNAHRIHYDRPYATGVEGYDGLVVHGPLIATLLMDLAQHELGAGDPVRFAFKAVSPLADTSPFSVCGRPDGPGRLALWARAAQGRLAMQADLQFRT